MVKIAFFRESLDIPKGVNVKVEGNNLISVKGPSGGPFGKSSGRRKVNHHGENSEYLVTCQTPCRNNVKAGITLGIIQGGFLRGTPIVEPNHAFFRCSLVCDDDVVVVIKVPGFEQMQVQGDRG